MDDHKRDLEVINGLEEERRKLLGKIDDGKAMASPMR